jgi:hypothetical protein
MAKGLQAVKICHRRRLIMKGKITGLFFAFLMCIATVNGFCQDINFIPLTWEIVSNLRSKLNELDYFLSKSFSIKINEKNDVSVLDINDGAVVSGGEPLSTKIIKFNINEVRGMLDNFFDVPRNEALELSFPENTTDKIRLKFARNINKNRFELVSAVIDTNNYIFRFSDEPPYLLVKVDLNLLNSEILAIPLSEGRNFYQNRQVNRPSVAGGNQFTSGNRYGAIYISGQGSLSKSAIIAYIRHRNHNVSPRTIENIVDMYLWASGREGINHDLAIAQMCRTTNFLGNENIMRTHNYAGFASTPEWSGRFSGGMRQGVTAHIQHLKGYTSHVSRSDLAEPLADPRWYTLDGLRGTIHTLEDLSGKWAPYNSSSYENDIRNIINEMRCF